MAATTYDQRKVEYDRKRETKIKKLQDEQVVDFKPKLVSKRSSSKTGSLVDSNSSQNPSRFDKLYADSQAREVKMQGKVLKQTQENQ